MLKDIYAQIYVANIFRATGEINNCSKAKSWIYTECAGCNLPDIHVGPIVVGHPLLPFSLNPTLVRGFFQLSDTAHWLNPKERIY